MKAKILGVVIVGAGCIAALPAFASPTSDGVPHARYSSMGYDGDGGATWGTSHETRQFGANDFHRVETPPVWKRPRPPMAAPEIDQSAGAVALTLLVGGLAFLRARRRRV